MVIYSEWLTP